MNTFLSLINLLSILIPSPVSLFRLKPLDIEFMKRLHDKVNVIPLIAKADTLTPEECQLFKKQVFVLLYMSQKNDMHWNDSANSGKPCKALH